MSSSKVDFGKSEKRRIWELEEQLENEQHAHRKTKFALREVQGRMDSEKTGDFERRIRELRQEYSNLEQSVKEALGSMKSLESERDKLKMELEKEENKGKNYEKRLEEYEEKVWNFERGNQNLRVENEENRKTLETEKAELKMELERQKEKLRDDEGKWNRMRIEKEKLEEDLKTEISDVKEINKDLAEGLKYVKSELEKESQKATYFEKRVGALLQNWSNLEQSKNAVPELSKKAVELERDKLKTELERENGKGKNYETRLREYEEEVKRLYWTKNEALWGCRGWISRYSEMIDRLISVLKETNSTENEEEVRELEEDKKEADDEWEWWNDYQDVCGDLFLAFSATQDIRDRGLSSKQQVYSSQSKLNVFKAPFDVRLKKVRRGLEEKPWTKEYIDSKHFYTWQKVLVEALVRIKKS